MSDNIKIAVIIPCYKVKEKILDVLTAVSKQKVAIIYIVDDHCPENTGEYVRQHCSDPRVLIIRHSSNQGVGAAVITGYKKAIEDGFDIFVKIDGDGQMDPELLVNFINPIMQGEADYTKGNRFFNLEDLQSMPGIRLFGNAILSFLTKLSSGYWHIFDPTNGYTAIHKNVARQLPLDKLSKRFFFETDILFRLNTLHAAVSDIPMRAQYIDETSNLKISRLIGDFIYKHLRNFIKRIFYNYYLRDISIASLELPAGLVLTLFGVIYGAKNWIENIDSTIATPAGTVMLSAMPLIMGLQFILAFFAYDIASVPKRAIYSKLSYNRKM